MPQAEETQARPRAGRSTGDASLLLGRTAPHNIDAEEALLACCIIDPVETLSLCQEKGVRPPAFYRPAHQILFQVIEDMSRDSAAGIDQITLIDRLSGRTLGTLPGKERDPDADRNLFEFIGGLELLNRITSRIESTVHVQHWLGIVVEKHVLRRLIGAATSVVENCYTNEGQLDQFIDQVEREIFQISQDRVTESAAHMSTSVDEATQLIAKIMAGDTQQGLLTGYKDLDRMTFGLHKGQMVVLAARPSMGKTSFAMNIAENAVLPTGGREGLPTLVYSLEMGADQLAMRMLCCRARVNMKRIRDRIISKDDMRNITQTANEMKRAPLWIDDAGHTTILELRAKARRMQARLNRDKRKLGLIVIDYLQLISGTDSRVQREQQIAEISRGIKSLAKELEVPVLVLSQLNREAEKENRQPRLSDLRESGSIEQDADVVLLLAKDRESNDKASVPTDNKRELIIAKQRNGPVGSIPLTFIPEYTRFENFTESV